MLQVRQRRVAGPEVVEHQPDPELPQPPERADPRLGLVHQHALGDLDLEAARIQSGLVEDGRDLVDEVRLDELASRQVDRHEQLRTVRPRIAPGSGLPAGGLEHPAAERQDEAGLLGQRDEGDRRHEATYGMLPADERLEADDALGGQVDQRLIVQPKLATLDALTEVVLEVDPLDRLVGHRRLEQGVALGRVRLRPDHGDFRLAQHLVRRGPARPPQGDPDRGADEPLAAAHRERRPQVRPDPLGDDARLLRSLPPRRAGCRTRRRRSARRCPPAAGRRPVAGRRPPAADRRRCGRHSR